MRRMLRTILERTLSKLSSLLLELLNGTLVDTTALVDQVTSGGGLAGIDVSDDCIQANDGERSGLSEASRQLYEPTTLTWVFSFPILVF